MPRHRIGPTPLSPAERQARRRAKLNRQIPGPPATPSRRISPRPKRWAVAVAALVNLQEEYRGGLDNLPPNLESSPAGRQAAGHRRTRPRGASGDRAAARLRPRLRGEEKSLDTISLIQA